MSFSVYSDDAQVPVACPLPLSDFEAAEDYVESLLSFITSSSLFQNLCGGVHVSDFLTKEPDLYGTILPGEWREWFQYHDVSDILDLLMREKTDEIEYMKRIHLECENGPSDRISRKGPVPPMSLLDYIICIRKHALDRSFTSHDRRWNGNTATKVMPLPRHVAVGMKPKKFMRFKTLLSISMYLQQILISPAVTR